MRTPRRTVYNPSGFSLASTFTTPCDIATSALRGFLVIQGVTIASPWACTATTTTVVVSALLADDASGVAFAANLAAAVPQVGWGSLATHACMAVGCASSA